MLDNVLNLGGLLLVAVLGVTLAHGDEPLVQTEINGMPVNVEVWGAESCDIATDYARQALTDPSKSATGESWSTDDIKIIKCSKRYGNRNVTINMTHLDGWAWNK